MYGRPHRAATQNKRTIYKDARKATWRVRITNRNTFYGYEVGVYNNTLECSKCGSITIPSGTAGVVENTCLGERETQGIEGAPYCSEGSKEQGGGLVWASRARIEDGVCRRERVILRLEGTAVVSSDVA